MKTLPDYLEHNLKILSIGLNPSPVSVESGYYFANPRNRFWKALNGSDLVKKPTRMGDELRAADYREGAPVLKEKILTYQPGIAWFHGKGTYKNYLKYADGTDAAIPWGAQKHTIGKTRVFVTPNPSPANAQYSLDDLIRFYNEMVSYQIRELFGLGIS
ncbi:MAG: mismatch-specific DNA-glycosylase [Gammaproteobacteria bacterium]